MRPLTVLARVLPAHPARPVGGIGDEVGGPACVARQALAVEDRPHVGRKRGEPSSERIIPRCAAGSVDASRLGPGGAADRLQSAQFRADQEQIDAARDRAEPSVMQDHAAIGVIRRRARIGDGQVDRVGRERGRARRAEKRRDRVRRVAGEVRRVRDQPAPRKSRRRHQQERIEHDLEAARLQIADAAHDAGVGRRAAIGRAAARQLRQRQQSVRALRQAGDAPVVGDPRQARRLRERPADEIGRRINAAARRFERVGEPGADQRHGRAFGMRRLQLVEGIGISVFAPPGAKNVFSGFSAPPATAP